MTTAPAAPAFAKGLVGVVAAETALSSVDGANGILTYRGLNIHDLAARVSYEEIVHLLFYGKLPNKKELTKLAADLALHPRWSLATALAGAPTFQNFRPAAGAGPAIAIGAMLQALAQAQIDWSTLERMRARWKGALIVKGVLHPHDARRIAGMGADGIVVSNHGGRQLGAVPASIECLPPIRQAVGPDFSLLLDSGVRSGDDIAKALAAGADFVLLGRAFLYGCGALGAVRGPDATIDILRGELDTALAQLGCARVADLQPDMFFEPQPARQSPQGGTT